MNFGMKDRLVYVSARMFVCLREQGSECQSEKAWVC